MNEKTILYASTIITIIGLLFLYIYSDEFDTKVIVQNLEQLPTSQPVTIQGTITQLQKTDKATFLQISGQRTETADIILFNKEAIFLEEGQQVEISGTVEQFKGKPEIVANKVIVR